MRNQGWEALYKIVKKAVLTRIFKKICLKLSYFCAFPTLEFKTFKILSSIYSPKTPLHFPLYPHDPSLWVFWVFKHQTSKNFKAFFFFYLLFPRNSLNFFNIFPLQNFVQRALSYSLPLLHPPTTSNKRFFSTSFVSNWKTPHQIFIFLEKSSKHHYLCIWKKAL